MVDIPVMALSLAVFTFCQFYFSTIADADDVDLWSYFYVFYHVGRDPTTWFVLLLISMTVLVSIITWK